MVPGLVPHLDLHLVYHRRKKSKGTLVWYSQGSALGALFGVGYGFLEKEGLSKSSGKMANPKVFIFLGRQEKEYGF